MARTAGRLLWLIAVLAAALTLGCSQTDKKLVQLKGTVKFKGVPVPAGYIQFTPDASKGGQGSATVAQIKDGVYDTSLTKDSGIVPGPNVIRIGGFDGKVVPRWHQGKQIFNVHEVRETLAEGTMDFTVPESAADNLKIDPTADQ
jgi:hypothetical protein